MVRNSMNLKVSLSAIFRVVFLSWPKSVKVCYFSIFDYGGVGDH